MSKNETPQQYRPEEPFPSEPSRFNSLPLFWPGTAQRQGESVARHASCAARATQAEGQHVAVVLHHQSEEIL